MIAFQKSVFLRLSHANVGLGSVVLQLSTVTESVVT